MVETFTPAVCGSRNRQRLAALLFALAAVATAAALGVLLGAVGAALGGGRAVFGAAGLALLAAAREAGLVRLPLPQARRQVPESWRFTLPLPLWSTGYGAGLGAGVFTYQPVSTFWVACAGALALARPVPAALCFALYGTGRALMVVWPRRGSGDAAEAVERLAERRGTLLRANVAVLAGCGLLLALAPAAGAAVVGSGLDPAVSENVLSWARQNGSVVVDPGGDEVVYPDASAPALDGDLLAYVADDGIRIVEWRSGKLRKHIRTNATAVALDWPRVAFRREDRKRRRLILRNLDTGTRRTVAKTGRAVDLGRPALRNQRLVWHVANRWGSSIYLYRIRAGSRQTFVRSKIALLRSPTVYRKRVVWVDERAGVATIRFRQAWGGKVRRVARVKSRDLGFWSTAMSASRVYATRWSRRTRDAKIHSFGY